jgi:hypothetical protein
MCSAGALQTLLGIECQACAQMREQMDAVCKEAQLMCEQAQELKLAATAHDDTRALAAGSRAQITALRAALFSAKGLLAATQQELAAAKAENLQLRQQVAAAASAER